MVSKGIEKRLSTKMKLKLRNQPTLQVTAEREEAAAGCLADWLWVA